PPSAKKRRTGRIGTSRKLAENPDHVRDVFAATCPHCEAPASPADQPDVHAYDHIDLPPVAPITTRIRLHSGECSCCGGRIKAAPPSDMPPASPFGPGVVAVVVYLHTRHMVSYERLREILHGLFGLRISEGAIANMLMRSGDCFAAEAERIEAVVRKAPVIASDETSARVMGQTCWQWVFACDLAVAHRIAASRAKAVVSDFLDGEKPRVWVSDRYGGQMGHGDLHQACLAHLLRDAQYAIDAGDKVFAPGFKFLLKRALAIARRRKVLKDATLKAHQRDLARRLSGLLACKPDTVAGRKFRTAMEKARDKLFVFVTRRNVPPTNNLSERLLRLSVIFRKVTNGFRSAWGAQVYADICSVTATGNLQGLTALDAIRTCLKGGSVLAPA
ncbi:MAG: IS66 family transposase, partial [Alphaproteobacteria bacterium]|nr:IS66 family transposase [Alphaproteobacteria bacterium]